MRCLLFISRGITLLILDKSLANAGADVSGWSSYTGDQSGIHAQRFTEDDTLDVYRRVDADAPNYSNTSGGSSAGADGKSAKGWPPLSWLDIIAVVLVLAVVATGTLSFSGSSWTIHLNCVSKRCKLVRWYLSLRKRRRMKLMHLITEHRRIIDERSHLVPRYFIARQMEDNVQMNQLTQKVLDLDAELDQLRERYTVEVSRSRVWETVTRCLIRILHGNITERTRTRSASTSSCGSTISLNTLPSLVDERISARNQLTSDDGYFGAGCSETASVLSDFGSARTYSDSSANNDYFAADEYTTEPFAHIPLTEKNPIHPGSGDVSTQSRKSGRRNENCDRSDMFSEFDEAVLLGAADDERRLTYRLQQLKERKLSRIVRHS